MKLDQITGLKIKGSKRHWHLFFQGWKVNRPLIKKLYITVTRYCNCPLYKLHQLTSTSLSKYRNDNTASQHCWYASSLLFKIGVLWKNVSKRQLNSALMLCPDRHYGDSSDASNALLSISVKSLYFVFFWQKHLKWKAFIIWVFSKMHFRV